MDEKSNLELSEETVCTILQVLLNRGFSKGLFSFNDLKAAGVDDECSMFFDLSVKWLIEEEIIRVGNMQEYSSGETLDAINPILTAKGLSLLGKRLEAQDGQVFLRDHQNPKSSRSEGYQNAGTFLGSLFGSTIKSVG